MSARTDETFRSDSLTRLLDRCHALARLAGLVVAAGELRRLRDGRRTWRAPPSTPRRRGGSTDYCQLGRRQAVPRPELFAPLGSRAPSARDSFVASSRLGPGRRELF